MKKKIKLLLVFVLSCCFFNNVKAVYSDKNIGTYEQELAKFPTQYQNKIRDLHNIYKNAIFVKQDKFFSYYDKNNPSNSYKEVSVAWSKMLAAEKSGSRSEIEASAPSSYRTSTCGEWSGSTCRWYVASEAGISYYMNPYNFLDEKHVFMFQSQYYNSAETEAGVNNVLSDAYKNKECPGSGGKTYAKVILEAANKYNISAYMLASRLRQENPKGTEALVTGRCLTEGTNCTKYYNFYNIQASGSTDSVKISNGIKCASGTLVRDSDGYKLCNGYNWTSPYLSILGGAQFIQSKYIGVNDKYNVKGQMTNYLQKWDHYGPNLGGHQYMQNIRAPYFEAETTYKSNMAYMGKDFKYIFYIPIFTGAPNTSGGSGSSGNTKKGDINADGKIDSVDLLRVKQHLMNIRSLSGNNFNSADINSDGKIDSVDLLRVKQHLMGIKTIS